MGIYSDFEELAERFRRSALAKWERFVLGPKGFRFRLQLVNGSTLARCLFGLAKGNWVAGLF